MKLNLRILSKLALLLVVFGFFMPMSCDFNGFQIADHASERPLFAVMMYIIFFSAVISIALGYRIYKNLPSAIFLDIALLASGVASGLTLYFNAMYGELRMQIGCYCIIVGWVLSGLFLLCSLQNDLSNEKSTNGDAKESLMIQNILAIVIVGATVIMIANFYRLTLSGGKNLFTMIGEFLRNIHFIQ